jgi:ATP-dependent Lon protease
MTTAADRGTRGGGSVFVIPDDAMIIVPIRNVVLFPGMILPLTIGREAVDPGRAAGGQDRAPVGILLQREAEVEAPGPDDLCLVGTVANILRYVTLPGQRARHCLPGAAALPRRRVPARLSFSVARVGRIDEPR